VVAILPVKSFDSGKGRMADRLSTETRTTLAMSLADRTAAVVSDAGLIPVLVAGDAGVAEWALRNGLASIPDPGGGLNQAARAGVEWAAESRSDWMVLHSDLPLLSSDEVRRFVEVMEEADGAIAPSAEGGTSAIGGHDGVVFDYGPASFSRHLGRRPEMGIVAALGFLHDVDSYRDLESAMRHPRGRWLRTALA
jgi:2-phospho-L-lactate/phosphoenolpyruvate guanylyltransferase